MQHLKLTINAILSGVEGHLQFLNQNLTSFNQKSEINTPGSESAVHFYPAPIGE